MTDEVVTPVILALAVKRLRKVEAKVASVSKQQGPVGPVGQTGPTGANGKDGRDGTDGKDGREGPRGHTGQAGAPGADGKRGPKGEKGEPGKQGDPGPAPQHEVSGSKIRFKNPDGSWGKWLKAPKGEKGADGQNGGTVIIRGAGGGSGSASLGDLLPGNASIEPVGVAVVQGGQWVNLPWSAFVSVIAGAIDMGVDYARREDFVGDTTLYRGEAAPGSLDSAAVWKIKRVTFSPDGDVTTQFAGGSSDFVHAWADRATLEYV